MDKHYRLYAIDDATPTLKHAMHTTERFADGANHLCHPAHKPHYAAPHSLPTAWSLRG